VPLSTRWGPPPTTRSIFSERFTPSGSFYQSVRSSVEAVDFRLNSRRSLDVSLLDENQVNFLRLRKLHFFLIYDEDEDFDYITTKPKKVRLLENDVWGKYLQGISGTRKKYCANHWSCSPSSNEGWDTFVKLRYGSANFLTIMWYIILISTVALLINISSSFLYAYLENQKFPEKLFGIKSGQTKE